MLTQWCCSLHGVYVKTELVAKWSLHLSAASKQQETRLPRMRSYFVHFHATYKYTVVGQFSFFLPCNIVTFFAKAGKISNFHSYLHTCVESVHIGWNMLHTRPNPLRPVCIVWHDTSCHGQPVVHQSLIFFSAKAKKKVSSAMQSAGIFLAQSNMRSKIIEITTNKLLPYYIIATGGAMLRTSRARFLHR